jgi:hypothetical protein
MKFKPVVLLSVAILFMVVTLFFWKMKGQRTKRHWAAYFTIVVALIGGAVAATMSGDYFTDPESMPVVASLVFTGTDKGKLAQMVSTIMTQEIVPEHLIVTVRNLPPDMGISFDDPALAGKVDMMWNWKSNSFATHIESLMNFHVKRPDFGDCVYALYGDRFLPPNREASTRLIRYARMYFGEMNCFNGFNIDGDFVLPKGEGDEKEGIMFPNTELIIAFGSYGIGLNDEKVRANVKGYIGAFTNSHITAGEFASRNNMKVLGNKNDFYTSPPMESNYEMRTALGWLEQTWSDDMFATVDYVRDFLKEKDGDLQEDWTRRNPHPDYHARSQFISTLDLQHVANELELYLKERGRTLHNVTESSLMVRSYNRPLMQGGFTLQLIRS